MALITIIIIVVTGLFSYRAFSDYNLFERFKFQPQAITEGKQYDRLLMSGFLHVDMGHLIFNMLTLYFFATPVIQFFAMQFGGSIATGSVVFAVIYLLSIVGGNLLALFFQKNNPRYSAVGASGGVMGIVMAAIAIFPNELQIYGFIPDGFLRFCIWVIQFMAFRNNWGTSVMKRIWAARSSVWLRQLFYIRRCLS